MKQICSNDLAIAAKHLQMKNSTNAKTAQEETISSSRGTEEKKRIFQDAFDL